MTRDTSTSADRAVMTGNTGTSALPPGPLTVYLKRHFRLPWLARLAALVDPAGRHSPGAAEWSHLERARSLGVPVPEVVAAGERIGPWANLQSYLMVAELTGSLELNVALPELAAELRPLELAAFKRRLVPEMARITAACTGPASSTKTCTCAIFISTSGGLQTTRRK